MKHSELHFDPLAPGFIEGRQILMATRFGSHLYGVANASSDEDTRYVMLPKVDELLLGQVNFGCDSNPQNLQLRDGVTDGSAYTLMRFLTLLGRLDLGAVEMLFASKARDTLLLTSPVMAEIYAKREFLLAGTSSAAMGHARQIAGKLMPATDRYLGVFEQALDLVRPLMEQGKSRLSDAPDVIEALDAIDGISVFTGDTATPRTWSELSDAERAAGRVAGETLFVQVQTKKVPTTAFLRDFAATLEKPLKRETQRRARVEAQRFDRLNTHDVSMKDAYHAVRLMRESVELFETREIRFPRPDAEDLKAIRRGEKSFEELRDMLARLFEDVAIAEAKAPFREEPDAEVTRDIIMSAHRQLLLDGGQS